VQLTALVRQKKPDIVYLPHRDDAHYDHKITHKLAIEAVKRAGKNAYQECGDTPWKTKTILAYEVWTPLTSFQYVEDITKELDTKITAMQKHVSQLANVAWDEAIQGLCRYRGAMTDQGKYCEVFQVLKISSL
jgi:LmbE family N-acetylglucosaminyl deacetylase